MPEPRPDDDFALLDRWRDGDTLSGDLLLRRHFDDLYRFFRNKAGEHADDLTQRAMLGCIEHRDRFRKQSSFRTYLFAIARHELFDHLRKHLGRPAGENLSNLSLRDLGPSPSSAVARDERERKLDLALIELPIDQQIALELAYRYEMTGPEIGEVLGLEPNTVRSRLARGRKTLREYLERLGLVLEDMRRST